MARRGHAYPQATPTAADLIDGALVVAPADPERHGRSAAGATPARRGAGRRGARLGAARRSRARRPRSASARWRSRELARRLPVVAPRESEVRVRRHLAAGAPAVVVGEGRSTLGRRSTGSAAGHALHAGPLRARARRRQPGAAGHGRAPGRRARRAGLRGRRTRARCAARAVARACTTWTWSSKATPSPSPARWPMRPAASSSSTSASSPRRSRWPIGARVDLVDRALGALRAARRAAARAPGAHRAGSQAPRLHGERAGGRARLRRRSACSIRSAAAPTWRDGGCESCTRCRSWRTPRGSSAPRATRPAWASPSIAWSARCQALALSLAPYPALSPARIVAELERILADAEPAAALTRWRAPGPSACSTPATGPRAPASRACAPCRRRSPGRARARVPAPPLELLATALAADQTGGDRRRRAARARPERRAAGARAADAGRRATALAGGLQDGATRATRPAPFARRARPRSPGSTSRATPRPASGSTGCRRRSQAERPALGGGDVIALGVAPGPEVAAVLAARPRRPARGGNSRPAG